MCRYSNAHAEQEQQGRGCTSSAAVTLSISGEAMWASAVPASWNGDTGRPCSRAYRGEATMYVVSLADTCAHSK